MITVCQTIVSKTLRHRELLLTLVVRQRGTENEIGKGAGIGRGTEKEIGIMGTAEIVATDPLLTLPVKSLPTLHPVSRPGTRLPFPLTFEGTLGLRMTIVLLPLLDVTRHTSLSRRLRPETVEGSTKLVLCRHLPSR